MRMPFAVSNDQHYKNCQHSVFFATACYQHEVTLLWQHEQSRR